jgi:acetyl esterase/lipase
MVGSSEMIPKPQIEYLASKNFTVVIPNYRLAPQVTAKDAFADSEEAYEWATTKLAGILKSDHAIELDASKVVAYGHSSGGTLALHMASSKTLKAATAFYPSLFGADPSSALGKPTSVPPFGIMPDFEPTAADWAEISPEGKQVSEAALALPGTVPRPRNKWQMSVLKNGQWNTVVLPDGDLAAVDPMTRLSEKWAPIMIVQGELDNVPGSSLELAQRAEKEMKAAGVKEVQLEVVPGETHMFDLPPMVGTSDLGHKWQAVMKGLDWLVNHV